MRAVLGESTGRDALLPSPSTLKSDSSPPAMVECQGYDSMHDSYHNGNLKLKPSVITRSLSFNFSSSSWPDTAATQSCEGTMKRSTSNCNTIEWTRSQSGLLVSNAAFQKSIIFIIILNSLTMGIETFDFVTENSDMQSCFEVFDQVFLIIFTVEVGFQLLYHGFGLFKHGFLTLDVSIVIMSWIFQPLRAFRIIRAVRLVWRIQRMRETAAAFVNVLPSIGAVTFMLFLLFYIFGVMFTKQFKHLYEEGALDMDYFSRLDRTFFTLFQLMTLQSWSDISKQVMVVYPWAWLPFISFVMIAHFVIVNLIAGLQREKIDEQILHFKYTYSELEDTTTKVLEQKIDDLTIMIQSLLTDKTMQRTITA